VNPPPTDVSTSLGTLRLLGLLMVALALGVGQLLFKLAAERLVLDRGVTALMHSFVGWPMAAALLVYGAATVLWVYLLHGLPLSRAYPFIALAFAFVPLMSWLVFRDTLDVRYGIGLALMLAGLYLVATGR
jgi:drug/metabolite transporter (DMT)-like permease